MGASNGRGFYKDLQWKNSYEIASTEGSNAMGCTETSKGRVSIGTSNGGSFYKNFHCKSYAIEFKC